MDPREPASAGKNARRSPLKAGYLTSLCSRQRPPQVLTELEQLQAARNKAADQIGKLKAQKQDATAALKEVEGAKGKIKDLEAKLAEIEPKLNDLLLRINNIPDKSVPVGASAADNKVLREVGKVTAPSFKPKSHLEVGESLGILDSKPARNSPARGFRSCAARVRPWSARSSASCSMSIRKNTATPRSLRLTL